VQLRAAVVVVAAARVDEVDRGCRREALATIDLEQRASERVTKLSRGAVGDADGCPADRDMHGPAAAVIDLAIGRADEGLDDVLQGSLRAATLAHASPWNFGQARRMQRVAAFVPLVVVLAAVLLAWRSGAAWLGPTEWWFGVFALLGTAVSAAAIVHDEVRVRVFVTCTLLLGAPALRIGELLGHPLPYIMWDHGLIASIVSVVVVLAIVGLVRRREWGRWLALGGSLAGLGGALLNGLGTLADPGIYTWAHACTGAGCLALVLLLGGPTMRDAFEGTAQSQSLWRSDDPIVRALRWTLISTLVSAPMLLVYAVTQPIVPGTVGVAWALAIVQLGATVLCLLRKVVGALLLSLAGAALLVFTLVCTLAAAELWIIGYYAVFWAPAGLGSVVAGIVMLRPLRAFLRGE
jgi:hypothetical protein